ncbi:hypothetical protein WOC76_23460 [Methylocystis sp. IM3]|jgi:hypothetical protein|uniref:hypothetical protein n=1 Tax=unclassified Methylocystis TaxID=2625913 RepID=UPI000FB30FF1|nr:MAG: hypothetical protein EKK29_22475 [Hyphomicrobiales bacterium]
MKMARATLALVALARPAFAHHLDDYDRRLRRDADLPAAWFTCGSAKECEMVSVPCQSDLAVAARHAAQARERLVETYPFCLGSSLHDTEAACEEHECVTKATKPK